MRKFIVAFMICLMCVVPIWATQANIVYLSNGTTVGMVPVEYKSQDEIDVLIEEFMPDGFRLNERVPVEVTDGSVFATIETAPIVTGVNARLARYSGGYDDAYVSWNKYSTASGYYVYERRPNKTSKWTYLGKTKDTSFIEKDLYDGWKYEFKVIPYKTIKGENRKITADYSSVSLTTLKKVTGLKASKKSSRVSLRWDNIYGESGYQIMAKREGKTSYFETGKTSKELSIRNTRYEFKVRAYKLVKGDKVFAPWSNVAVI